MSWDEIDFNLIVPGMITRGPAEASMSDILNQFARAGDERQNLIGENPVLAEITFEAGEIRNTTFWDKYRDLIAQYRAIMGGWGDGRRGSLGYYTREALIDTVNFPLYAIDFRALLGNDLFNRFNNNSIFSNNELFTAEVINGFYTIYQNTEILYVIRDTTPLSNPIRNLPNITINSGDYYESVPVTGAAGGNFNDLLPLTWVQEVDKFTNTIGFFGMDATLDFVGGVWKWSTSYWRYPNLRNKNGLDITLEMRDLDNNILAMDFVTLGNIGVNEFTFAHVQGSQGPYNSDYPVESGGTSSTPVNILDLTVSHDPSGTTNRYFVSGGAPLQPLPLTFPETKPNGRSESQEFSLTAERNTFIDLNNPALEFYIAP